MSYFCRINGLDGIILRCESKAAQNRHIAEPPIGDKSPVCASKVEEILGCPVGYAESYQIDEETVCLVRDEKADLFEVIEKYFLLDGALDSVFFANKAASIIESILTGVEDLGYDGESDYLHTLVRAMGNDGSEEQTEIRLMCCAVNYSAVADGIDCEICSGSLLSEFFALHGLHFSDAVSQFTPLVSGIILRTIQVLADVVMEMTNATT